MRTHGHRAARIDPLNLLHREEVAALDPSRYDLSDSTQSYPVDGIVWTNPDGPNLPSKEIWPLERVVRHLRAVYVGNIAYEFMHSPSKSERLWFSHLLESSAVAPRNVVKKEDKKRMWELMARSEVFDQYLQLKFPNLKRYGLEGGESMLPALDTLFAVSSEAGIEHIVLAMPHRGRLNLLTDLLGFPLTELFHKIGGGSEIPEELGYSGDVISHLGMSRTLIFYDWLQKLRFSDPVSDVRLNYGEPSRSLKVSLLPNPSHLGKAAAISLALLISKTKHRNRGRGSCRVGEDSCKAIFLDQRG
jgi:probable 2-oxoglutarate dehydrogenase E1 component DHKTD1